MLPWQPFLAFYIWDAHCRHLKNTTEPSMCSGDAALCQITLTTCYSLNAHSVQHTETDSEHITRKPRNGAAVIAASMHGFAVGSSKAP